MDSRDVLILATVGFFAVVSFLSMMLILLGLIAKFIIDTKFNKLYDAEIARIEAELDEELNRLKN